jgi:predicted transcriptional regulator
VPTFTTIMQCSTSMVGVFEAAGILGSGGRSLALVGGENKMVGIITRSNLMHAMVSLARSAPKVASNDAVIRERLVDELEKEKWAPAATTNIVVLNGVVELWGTVFDDRQREALKVAAENIPGVKAVKDHLVWIEPTSGMWFG